MESSEPTEEEKALAAQMRREEVRPLQWQPGVEEGWFAIPTGQDVCWAIILAHQRSLDSGDVWAQWEILVGDSIETTIVASDVCKTVEAAKQAAEEEIHKWLSKGSMEVI